MAKTDLAIRADFRNYMSLGDKWPSTTAFANWMNRQGGMRSGAYGRLKKGDPVPTRLIVQLVAFLKDCASETSANSKNQDNREAAVAFSEYLKLIGISNVRQHSAEFIAGKLIVPDNEDYHGREISGLVDILLNVLPKSKHFVNACNDEAEVKEAARWVYIKAAREHDPRLSPLSPEQAVDAYQARFGMSLANYQELVLSWWRFDPWTVMFARGNRVAKTGMSIVLPLRGRSQISIATGRRGFLVENFAGGSKA